MQSGLHTTLLDGANVAANELMEAVSMGDVGNDLNAAAAQMLASRGKNLRSTLALLAATAGPRPDDPAVRDGAAAIELFHMVTLAHDDVIDDGRVRRGAQTVSNVYGNVTASLAAGALFARAIELIAGCGDEPVRRFASTAGDVCVGQMRELEDVSDATRSIERYELAVEGKTASLFGFSAWLGSTLSGASVSVTHALERFGHEFGMAFQIADDILDLVASERLTGKQQAKDLEQGIYTLPVLHALKVDRGLRAMLRRDPTQIDPLEAVRIVANAGGIDAAMKACEERASRARTHLRDAPELSATSARGMAELLAFALAKLQRLTSDEAVRQVA
jgi:heptaprenyl diphosphate synthase